jgi:aarF domain-containing kinase
MSKAGVLGAGCYAYYRISPPQTQANILGYLNSSVNSVIAAKILAMSVLDYKYSLRALDSTSDEYFAKRAEVNTRVANRILSLSIRTRGIYFKAGQYLGNLDRIMPKEFTDVLCVLQDSAPPLPYETIKTVIDHDLPGGMASFESFDHTAIAAASLAQVHKAKLCTGETVAVKVQYPFLKVQTVSDFVVLKIITQICNWLLKINDFKGIDLIKNWETFKDMCIQEIDFLHEKINSEKTKKIFEKDETVYVPKIHEKYSCSRVLTMEFVYGVKINDIKKIQEMGFDTKDIADLVVNIFSKMIFLEGHVHCDPHPGNILITSNKGKPQIILLDHGFYRYVSDDFRKDFCRLWHGLVQLDYDTVKKIADGMGLGEYYRYLPLVLTYRTINSNRPLGEIISREEAKELHKKNEITFEKITNLMQRLPPDLIFIIRTSNMVAMHNLRLGGSTRNRLMVYTKYSFRALYSGLSYYWELFKFYIFLVLHKL